MKPAKYTEVRLSPTEWAAFVCSRVDSSDYRTLYFSAYEWADWGEPCVYWIKSRRSPRVWRVVADRAEGA